METIENVSADVSVRPALPGDQDVIADIQLASWSAALGETLVGLIPRDEIVGQWLAAIEIPPTREHRVLTALDGNTVVGFAAIGPGGEIIALEVSPDHRRKGHGARLLAACVDLMRSSGHERIRAWALETDKARHIFFESAGLAPGGVQRILDGPEGGIPEAMWQASIAQ